MKSPIPTKALKKHIAILGMNGSGKTSVAKSQIIEPALKGGERVCNIDPTGVGWGLRLGADGVKKGFAIYIVGGQHADFPLVRRDGKAWAEIVGQTSDSFVFDTSLLTVEDRSQWFTDFAEALLRKNKGVLNLVLDEAHLFAPQGGAKSGGVAPRMLHATNNLLALGRSRGLRITMISQRPAKLHKDALTQAHTLVAMMMTAPQDRAAVKDWIADQADAETGKEIIASLPSLNPGEGWVWAPRERVLDRAKFALPKTFDSSAAPDGVDGEGPTLAPINPDAIEGMLAKVAKETVASDVPTLRRRIAELERAVSEATGQTIDVEAIDADGFKRGYAKGSADTEANYQRILRAVQDKAKEFPLILNEVAREMIEQQENPALAARVKAFETIRMPKSGPATASQTTVGAPRHAPVASPTRAKPSPVSGGEGTLSGPEQRIVDAIRWWNEFGLSEPTQNQVAFIARYKPGSGTWSRYLSGLRSLGMIAERGPLVLTDAGRDAARVPDVTPTGEALRDAVMEKIDAPLRRILQPVMMAYPNSLSHAEGGEASGYAAGSGTWSRYLSSLRSLDLIESRGDLRAQDWLFP